MQRRTQVRGRLNHARLLGLCLAHPGTVGTALSGEIHICDEEGTELPSGEAGTIFFSGGGTFAYHNDAEKTRRVAVNEDFELLFHRVSQDEMTVTIIERGEVKQTLSMTVLNDGLEVRDDKGVTIARVQEENGEVRVFNALNEIIATYTAAESDEVSRIYQEKGAAGVGEFTRQEMADFGVAAR